MPRLFLAALILISTASAKGAPSLDIERLRPPAAREDAFGGHNGLARERGSWDVGLLFGWSLEPLARYGGDSADQSSQEALVASRMSASLSAAYGILDWFEVTLEVPVVLQQTSDVSGVDSFALGDVRVAPGIFLLRAADHFIDVALYAGLTAPTASSKDAYAGEKGVTAEPELAVGLPFGPVRVFGNTGLKLRSKRRVPGIEADHELLFRVGASYVPESLPVGFDLVWRGVTAFDQPYRRSTRKETSAEALVGLAYRPTAAVTVRLGGGVGLEPGWGNPTARAILGVTFSGRPEVAPPPPPPPPPEPPPPEPPAPTEPMFAPPEDSISDSDGDGIVNANDGAPYEAEDVDGYEDTDGIPDPVHAIVEQPAVDVAATAQPDHEPAEAGGAPAAKVESSPADRDGDGILDGVDRCPDEAEDVDGFQDANGCEDRDNDGDGIEDILDWCPDEPETINQTDDDDGCPDAVKALVAVEDDRIVIREKVQFRSGSAKIARKSHGLLRSVADALRTTPRIRRLEIGGHTDNQGRTAANKKLSQARADSVRKFLVARGVAPERLTSRGFGSESPVYPNSTPKGRSANRRVEFKVLEKAETKPKPIAGKAQIRWCEGNAIVALPSGTEVNAEEGLLIPNGSRLETGDGACVIALPSGTEVRARPHTEMTVLAKGEGRPRSKIKLWAGTIWNRVWKGAGDRETAHEVETRNAVAGVRGTDFRVSTSTGAAKSTRLETLTGSVAFGAGGKTMVVGAGFAASALGDEVKGPYPLPEPPTEMKPVRGEFETRVSLSWKTRADARYRLEIARDIQFSSTAVSEVIDAASYAFVASEPGAYFWRVSVIVDETEGAPSQTFRIIMQ